MNRRSIRILIGCEESGTVREAFRAAGFDAWSCDLLPDSSGLRDPQHIRGDLLAVLAEGGWDCAIMHPPCTYLSSSGLHWNKRVPGRAVKTEWALDFVRQCIAKAPAYWAIENPVGAIGTRIRKADQYVQPYEYGDDASKRTGLWLQGLPKLRADPAIRIPGRIVTRPDGRKVERWSNQTDSGQNRLGPSDDRAMNRSKTYPGIANAMALQWGDFLVKAIKRDRAA